MSLYRQKILDHYNNPRNQGMLKSADCISHGDNPLCGDEVDVFIKISGSVIKDIKFKASGCAISVAAISMLSEKIKGIKIDQVHQISEKDIKKMLGVELSVSRVKCAMLGLETVKKCLTR